MGVFNLEYCLEQLAILNEKRSREDYHRESFKKKYNFEPDKPGSDTGTITDKDGKKFKVDIRKYYKDPEDKDKIKKTETKADTDDEDGLISIGKDTFTLKGSHKNERMKAVIDHEIGHQRLHNLNPKSKTTDDKNKSLKVFRTMYDRKSKESGIDLDDFAPTEEKKNALIDNLAGREYAKTIKNSEDDRKRREDSYETAKKYENKDVNSHTKATEFEADRYSANKNSDRAVKKSIMELNKKSSKEYDKDFKKAIEARANKNQEASENLKNQNRKFKEELQDDYNRRSKALKDDDLKSSEVYK